MFFELLKALFPELSSETYLRIFGYLTVRSSCSLVFAFGVSLLIGPACIRRLVALKLGQQVRQFKTAETQQFNIHQHKHGTPTMGGLIIILATLLTTLLFCDPRNSYVWLTTAAMLGAGALGFADDYYKVAKKDHKGVSARTKLTVLMILGCALGAYLHFSRPHTAYGSLLLSPSDIRDGSGLALKLRDAKTPLTKHLQNEFSYDTLKKLEAQDPAAPLSEALKNTLVREFNQVISGDYIHSDKLFDDITLSEDAEKRLAYHEKTGIRGKSPRLNRLLLESAFPEIEPIHLVRGDSHLLVPFDKNLYPLLGLLFIPWVALVLTGTSNAVNLTDGLDGLAIGTVITVSIPYLIIAYLASRYDYSAYLYIPHVPQAGELSVFIAALLGASMGFLWFNSHPAEVFMGDTGSLSLGAVIGTIAVLTKHEILLVLIGGIFVIEALSVVLQVGSYRLRGKRILLMSPLHNHFVKKGTNEAKIIARFLIIATLLAMAGLSTLKLR